ncbi:MAG: YncE family protein [Janthinobacterium lividum]
MPGRGRTRKLNRLAWLSSLAGLVALSGCHRNRFPSFAADYREFAYVSDGATGTVTILDLVNLRADHTIQVGRQPTGLAVNPVRNEVYAVNTGSDSVSVIDAETNRVTATIGVHRAPYFLSVAPDGKRGYVANSGSNSVTVLDLEKHHEIGTVAAGEAPGMARVAPDNRTVVVSNRKAGSISIYAVNPTGTQPLHLRSTFNNCPGATDIAILPDSTKGFISCSESHQIMAVWLGVASDTWRGKQDASLQQDHLLAFLDVGKTPVHLALKPDGGEVFSTNFGANSISEVSTWTNDVSGTYPVVMQPSQALVSRDDSSLWITDFGADSATLYSIDDGRVVGSVRTGSKPDALAFSADEHLLLVVNSGSADVAVIRTNSVGGPTLFTVLPAGAQPNDIVVKSFHVH